MVIRDEQMRVFERAAEREFENRMIERIHKYFPKHGKMLDAAQLRALVTLALERARGYGLTTERNVALYLDVVCLLGSAFDGDPQMPWAAEILANRSVIADERADLLHQRSWEFGRVAMGDFLDLVERNDSSRILSILKDIRRMSVDAQPEASLAQFASELSAKIASTLPVRCGAIGKDALAAVIRKAFEAANRHRIHTPRGIALCAFISVVAGTGFDVDPQLPWAGRALESEPADAASRTKRLHRDALEALRQWWGIQAGAEA